MHQYKQNDIYFIGIGREILSPPSMAAVGRAGRQQRVRAGSNGARIDP